jgi:hypothetical protein
MKPFKTLQLAAATAALLAAGPSYAVVPQVDPAGRPARIVCGNTAGGQLILAQHADKIIFMLTDDQALVALLQADQAALDAVPRNTELDIKVLDDPRTIADLRGKVLSFIGAADGAVARTKVKIIDVDYAMVCPTRLPD